MSSNAMVRLRDVRPFAIPLLFDQKAVAVKLLEEAAEAFGAWQTYSLACQESESMMEDADMIVSDARSDLIDELADVMQAACNLAAACGIDDLRDALNECEARNAFRGRYPGMWKDV